MRTNFRDTTLASRYFLAETLSALNRTAEAREELQHVLQARVHADWIPEDQEWKEKAQRLRQTLH